MLKLFLQSNRYHLWIPARQPNLSISQCQNETIRVKMLWKYLYEVCFHSCEYSVNRKQKMADSFMRTQKSSSKAIKHSRYQNKTWLLNVDALFVIEKVHLLGSFLLHSYLNLVKCLFPKKTEPSVTTLHGYFMELVL